MGQECRHAMSRICSLHLRRGMFKAILFLISLFLFVLAITLMKEGAHTWTPLIRGAIHVTNPVRSLGFGWCAAYILMSGSPVAAIALTLLDAGAISPLATFAMITGSRLGASFTVIFLGFVYVLRGRSRTASLSMGLLAFFTTATTYLAGFVIGVLLLAYTPLITLRIQRALVLKSIFNRLFEPMAATVSAAMPPWATFMFGLALIIVSFALFDRCIPEMAIKESQLGRVSRLVYAPSIMFVLGGAVTLVSMSVSVSLGILVPLSNRGFIRRENVIPYIMGANITTFVDTLVVSLLIDNPAGFVIVLAEMLSITIISLALLVTLYRCYPRWMLAAVSWSTASNRNLAVCMLSILIAPLLLLLA